MARSVKLKFKSFVPGSGFNASGQPVQGKTRVVGRIDVSSYAHIGEALAPSDVGLTTIDWIDLKHENQAAGKEGAQPRSVRFNATTNDFYILAASAASIHGKPIAVAATAVVYFVAEGDSAAAPDLT